jgi:hypothetical protein
MSEPFFTNVNRRTVRGPVNPMDKSTIVSIFPKHVHEENVTIQPGVFDIPAGNFTKPSCVLIGPSSWWKEIDSEQPLIEIPVASVQVADAVVRDYCNGLLGCNMVDMMPGLFFLPGEWDTVKVVKEHSAILAKYKSYQDKWFMELVRIADILWSRSNGNPLAISNDSRLACNELNITNKDWLKDYQTVQLVRCFACGALRDPQFPICRECKAIADPEAAKKLNIQFAK